VYLALRRLIELVLLCFGSSDATVLIGAIGGALVPISFLSAWARAIAPATPTYWAMRGFRSVILTTSGPNSVVLPAAILSAMSLGFSVISVAKFGLDDTKRSWA